jgi:hypothetical protein
MLEVSKLFTFDTRVDESTDRLSEDLAQHALLDKWPDAQEIEFKWVAHNGAWLLFVSGVIPNEKGTIT